MEELIARFAHNNDALQPSAEFEVEQWWETEPMAYPIRLSVTWVGHRKKPSVVNFVKPPTVINGVAMIVVNGRNTPLSKIQHIEAA